MLYPAKYVYIIQGRKSLKSYPLILVYAPCLFLYRPRKWGWETGLFQIFMNSFDIVRSRKDEADTEDSDTEESNEPLFDDNDDDDKDSDINSFDEE